jgi:hypothetical protein
MGNRLFNIPVQKMKELPDLTEWGNLKNKFTGKALFRSKLYYLETGDLSVLDIINNKWFFEELFAFAHDTQDINLLPALKKIAGSERFDESMRQQASEIEEIIEDRTNKNKNLHANTVETSENEKAENARKILAGTRYPQTTEILRLLRDKSFEIKRLALFLIGKFKMTDMTQEVCQCLNIYGLEDDAFSVLQSFGNTAGKELDRCYLTTAGNLPLNKAVLRLVAKTHPAKDMSVLVERLWSNSRQIRELVLKTLINLKYNVNEEEKERLKRNIFETFGTLSWIISALVCLRSNNNAPLFALMEKEYKRWKDYLLDLLIITYDRTIPGEGNDKTGGKDNLSKSIPKLAGIIYTNKVKLESGDSYDQGNYDKKLKKLRHYFSCEVPGYKSLLEDIINCDYNLLSVWTKACTIRNIAKIGEEDLGESVVALLFSPEELLREEAARLVARSDRELYKTASGRIPEINRKKLDRIISGEVNDKEFVYEKVKFLSSCFMEVNEDKLLFLSEKIAFAQNDERGLYSQPYDSILWSFSSEKSDPEVFVNLDKSNDLSGVIKDIRTACYFCYVLPLNSVLDFNFQYPESSFGIFKYIDSKED